MTDLTLHELQNIDGGSTEDYLWGAMIIAALIGAPLGVVVLLAVEVVSR